VSGSGRPLASMIHPEAAWAWRDRAGRLRVLFLGPGDNGGPAGGPGGRGSTGPGCSFLDRWDGLVLVKAPAAGR